MKKHAIGSVAFSMCIKLINGGLQKLFAPALVIWVIYVSEKKEKNRELSSRCTFILAV